MRLAEDTGAKVRWWRCGQAPACDSSLSDLEGLLSAKTRIVALPHVSNILGQVMDLPSIIKAVRNGPAGLPFHLHHAC